MSRPPTSVEQLRAWYVGGDSLGTIALRIRASTETVRMTLRRAGVAIRPQGTQRHRVPAPVVAPRPVVEAEWSLPPEHRSDNEPRCTCGLRVDKDHQPTTCDMRGGAIRYARRSVDYGM